MKNIEEWKNMLNEIKDLWKTFSSHETSISFGVIHIDYKSAQEKIDTRFENF